MNYQKKLNKMEDREKDMLGALHSVRYITENLIARNEGAWGCGCERVLCEDCGHEETDPLDNGVCSDCSHTCEAHEIICEIDSALVRHKEAERPWQGGEMKTTVIHQNDKHVPSGYFKTGVFIGRPSKWGNPFKIGKDGTRKEVIEKYRAWILTQPELLKALPELKGKYLGCYCAPLACHGDVLAKLAEGE